MTPVEALVARYERRGLDGLLPPPWDSAGDLDGLEFVRVRGLAAFWRSGSGGDFERRAQDLAVCAHAIGDRWFAFVLAGTPEQVEAHVALDRPGTVSRLLQSAYPGVRLDGARSATLGTALRRHFAHGGALTGVPSRPPSLLAPAGGADSDETAHLERVVRGMRGATWAYAVRAYPRPHGETVQERVELLGELTSARSSVRRQMQQTEQDTTATGRRSASTSRVIGGELVDGPAQYLADLLERQLQRLDEALAVGRWTVEVRFGASDEAAARRLGGLLSGVLSGPDSRPERVRVSLASRGVVATRGSSPPAGSDGGQEVFGSVLSSYELARLVQLPREEAPGFAIADYAPFDVDVDGDTRGGRAARLGEVLRDGVGSGVHLSVPLDDLTKHGLVAGVTGSGKTTTLRGLLATAWDSGAPFLVIEPAKTEYRALLGVLGPGAAGSPAGRRPTSSGALRIYTLGNEQIAPFRLNPFEFETAEEPEAPGASLLLSHIDVLKAVFNAAFILYAPMPYVLDVALHEVYEDRGWDLATGRNLWLASREWARRHQFPVFPTLTDLYRKVETVTRRLGYEARIEQDVVAGLKARIGSLRVGAKGLMLDVPRGNDLGELLDRPTVLELEHIGNDGEKTFLIGLLLTRIYEFRRLQASRGALPRGLQHLLVVEEAHRLLRNVNTEVETESSNLRAQAVETFTNILSEIRRYGQGVLVAEQIPGKLAPDAVKNSSLKIVHRLLAADDRGVLASATGMTEAQAQHVATLPAGRAAVSAEGLDHPVLVAVEDVLQALTIREPTDADVAEVAKEYVTLDRYLPVPDFMRHGVPAGHFGAPEPGLYQQALRFVAVETGAAVWARLIVRIVYARASLAAEVARLDRQFAAGAARLAGGQRSLAFRLAVVLGAAQAIQERAAELGWPYTLADEMRAALTSGILAAHREPGSRAAAELLDRFTLRYEASTRRQTGPYPGCVHCRHVCNFRAEVRRVLTRDTVASVKQKLEDRTIASALQRYGELAALLRDAAEHWTGAKVPELDGLSYCGALVAFAAAGADEDQQEVAASQVASHLD